uniref:Uncharacterized protein n=1 Tax=Picea glauca TaxID=3330 RepID=A0A101LXJ3_PICGL|nr:hypothetical protein ABT39_MTgene6183 [Picea glauca]
MLRRFQKILPYLLSRPGAPSNRLQSLFNACPILSTSSPILIYTHIVALHYP